MNLKSSNYIAYPSDGKGEIGYISSPNVSTKPTKVKATTASIPVGTESMQRISSTQGEGRFTSFDMNV